MTNISSPTNWGRWGPRDELGSLNLITPELVRQAAGLVKKGKVYSLAVPLERDGPQWPARHKTWRVTTHRNDPRPGGTGGSDDVLTMHSHSGTHIDALCHQWRDGRLYNGFDAAESVSSTGAAHNAIHNVRFLAGRGVLLDVAGWKGVEHLRKGEVIGAADLDACARDQGVEVRPGDLLLVRTGWYRLFGRDRALFDSGEPGIDASTVPWLKQHDIVAVGSDNGAVEVLDSIPPAGPLPVHQGAIRDLGIYLLEYLDLEELAADGVRECLLVVAPLRLTGGAGSPINPLAIA